ncbi:MAG: hypothetical protein ACR2NU_02175, partial [Aeoliella sp.]
GVHAKQQVGREELALFESLKREGGRSLVSSSARLPRAARCSPPKKVRPHKILGHQMLDGPPGQ